MSSVLKNPNSPIINIAYLTSWCPISGEYMIPPTSNRTDETNETKEMNISKLIHSYLEETYLTHNNTKPSFR